MNLTNDQQSFVDHVMNGDNIFLTGKAGSGKSAASNHVDGLLTEKGMRVVKLAPTGIAANNIGGQTIHSFFKIPPYGVLDSDACNYVKSYTRRVWDAADIFLVDEVSMLRPDVFDAMHWALRKNGCRGLHDRQVILVGDLKQLPPVLDTNTKTVMYQKYTGENFLASKTFPQLKAKTVELNEIMRQSDIEFIEALNLVRDGLKAPYFRRFFTREPGGVILAPYNRQVAMYNNAGLQSQEGKLYTFDAVIEGKAKVNDFPLEATIQVKHGCKIMYLVNKPDSELRNGTLGTFIVKDDNYFIEVGGLQYPLERVVLRQKEYVYNEDSDDLELQEVGSIDQYPFKLAYALSIHKAQGLTFDDATIDLTEQCFAQGQLYVALSRVRTPAGLRIIPPIGFS